MYLLESYAAVYIRVNNLPITVCPIVPLYKPRSLVFSLLARSPRWNSHAVNVSVKFLEILLVHILIHRVAYIDAHFLLIFVSIKAKPDF